MTRTLRSSLLTLVLLATSCARPPAAPPWVQTAARIHCGLMGADAPRGPFRTDGCTMWPDRAWLSCCVTHDMEYWCGGRPQMRRNADRRFAACLALRGCRGAPLAWLGARISWWRWGWGHGGPGTR
jgi:hypothetical protein